MKTTSQNTTISSNISNETASVNKQEPEKKYEFIDDCEYIDGHFLKRIRALRDFDDVKKGDLGGYIESEDNLSHDGNCWVYDNACVYGNARVYGNVYGYAHVSGGACVFADAHIHDHAHVSYDATVFNYARVYGRAIVAGSARIHSYAEVYNYALINGRAKIHGKVYGGALVGGCA
ncbi:hypothetical protein, partial [Bartonella massiliensis]|uniref:hypothetical protein n=1 Tax=Bartonella massiliensis TaxID=929795 RepID=UPI001158E4F2